jgi:hypothetical protein
MADAVELRKRAEIFERRAEEAKDPISRAHYREMAVHYRTLAVEHQRIRTEESADH